MKKKNVLTSIADARFYHINWLSHVEGLIKGYKLNTVVAPVIKTDCKFGKWLYNEGQEIRNFTAFKEVEYFHDKVHAALLNLIVYLDKKVDKNFFNRAKVKRQEIKINIYFEQVKNASYDLLKALNKLEKEITSSFIDSDSLVGGIALKVSSSNVGRQITNDDVDAEKPIENDAIKENFPSKKVGKKKITKEERALIDKEIKRILGGE